MDMNGKLRQTKGETKRYRNKITAEERERESGVEYKRTNNSNKS